MALTRRQYDATRMEARKREQADSILRAQKENKSEKKRTQVALDFKRAQERQFRSSQAAMERKVRRMRAGKQPAHGLHRAK